MQEQKTREPQYEVLLEGFRRHGLHPLGLMASHLWRSDPRHLVFFLARYKFCAKMLAGKGSVLEAGCGDGFALPLLLQTVRSVHAVDFDPILVENARQINAERAGLTFETVDLTEKSPAGTFDAAYSLDVIEHIPIEKERTFLDNLLRPLAPGGTLIVGTPNVHASVHASKWSNEGHVNLKDDRGLRALLEPRFRDVFLFSMNDEVVHTGFAPMAHYLFAIAAGKRDDAG
ncbi:MAG TPA: class I SAM-dependent methyltransferase [bacterium]